MSFNPDSSKQTKEVLFSHKQSTVQLPDLIFNNNIITSTYSVKHLGLILDKKLNFNHHLKEKIQAINKG